MAASDRTSASSGGRSRQITPDTRRQQDDEQDPFNLQYRTQVQRPPPQQYYAGSQNAEQSRASQNGSRNRDTIFQPPYSNQRSAGLPQPQGPQAFAPSQRRAFSGQDVPRQLSPGQNRSQQPRERQPDPPRRSNPPSNVSDGSNRSSGGGGMPSADALNRFLRERQRGRDGPGNEPWAMVNTFKYEKKK